MKLGSIVLATIIAITAGAASAETVDFVVPFASAGPAQNGGTWRTDLTIHNAGRELLVARLSFHDATGEATTIDLPLPGRTTTAIADIVRNDFGRDTATGAIVSDGDDALIGKLSIASRSWAESATADIGQDVPALRASQAIAAGDTGILNGPAAATALRFDAGIFTAQDTTVEWRLLRRDGTIAKSVEVHYAAGTHDHYVAAAESLFGDVAQDADVIHARMLVGRGWVYGTAVSRQSGDPGFIQSGRTRENLLPRVVGIDTNFDGVVDFGDQDGDGVLDQTLRLATGRFPSGFRVIATDPEGAELTFAIASNDPSATMLDAQGRVSWWPSAGLRGTTGRLVIRVSDGIDSVDFTLPAQFN